MNKFDPADHLENTEEFLLWVVTGPGMEVY